MFNFLGNISVNKKLPVFSFLSISLGYWIRNEVSVEKNIGYFPYIDLSYTFLTHTELLYFCSNCQKVMKAVPLINRLMINIG